MFNREDHISKLEMFIRSRLDSSIKKMGMVSGFMPKRQSSEEVKEPQIQSYASFDEETGRPLDSKSKDATFGEVSIDTKNVVEESFESPCISPEASKARTMNSAYSMPRSIPSAKPQYSEPKKTSKKSAFSISDFISNRFEDSAVAKKLNYYMHERDITTAMIYERCYIDRKLISKITNRNNYHPSKNTMLALCLGLRLNMDEATEFLSLGGFSFSNTSKFDLVIEYILINEIYDVRFVNEMLEKYDQPLLGA